MYDVYLWIGGAVWYSGVCEQAEATKISRVSNNFIIPL